MARTFLVTLHYDGGRFAGWQRQAKGRTVQAELEAVLEQIANGPVRVHAAGRTDAGVHAVGMATSFTLPERWTPFRLVKSLNSLLPVDCWAESVREMKPGFHARTRAKGRHYRYLVGTDSGAASPFRRRYEWALGKRPDQKLLASAAEMLLGEHDFEAFSVRRSPARHRRSRIRVARWVERPADIGLVFEIAADRFLHHMVRMLVGTMMDIGLGRRALSDMPRLLALDQRLRTSPPAPAEGLYFVAADYPAEWFA